MYELSIECNDEVKNDRVIVNEEGLPIVYLGRGTVAGVISFNTYLVDGANIHLIYIGRYASIGENLKIYCDMDHDYNSLFMGGIAAYRKEGEADDRAKYGQVYLRTPRKGMTVIGNDVCIGDDVTMISDVVIGSGAVIETRSVITKDVPPYTVWAGNPARQIGERFPKEIADELMDISWWEFNSDMLKEAEEYLKGDVTEFVARYSKKEMV